MGDLFDLLKEIVAIEREKDSIELGVPSRIGKIKIYGDSGNPEVLKAKIDNMFAALAYANEKYDEVESASKKKDS